MSVSSAVRNENTSKLTKIGYSSETARRARLRSSTRIKRSPAIPAQIALFNAINGSKLSSDLGASQITGKERKVNGSGYLWLMLSASAQLYHCNAE
jgi:hypothetical protein